VPEANVDPLLGRELDGRYRLEARLGEGGLGVVYRAQHKRLKRAFAIKVLQPEYAENEQLRARFEREAQALGALTHPGVVGVTDFGIDGAAPYLVMELLEGATLDARMPLPADRALQILRDVLGAVAFAHGLGLVHRDLKPANVFLQSLPEGEERVRVLDFGLAKFLDGGDGAALTRPGATLGTPAYMSPEQALGGAASPRNDVYSLGILLYELLAHERPFRGEPSDVMRQHLLVPIPSIADRRAELATLGASTVSALDTIIQRAAAKTPLERYADAGEMRAALDQALGRQSGAHPAVSRSGEIAPAAVIATPKPASPSSEDVVTRAPVHRDRSEPSPLAPVDAVAATMISESGARPAAPSIAHPPSTTGGPAADTRKDAPPPPRMVASRPPQRSPVTPPPAPTSSGSGVMIVLGLVLVVAASLLVLILPRLLGLDFDPLTLGGAGGDLGSGATSGPAIPAVVIDPPRASGVDAAVAPAAPAPMVFAARDPWLEPVPPELARFRERVARGETLGRGARATLRQIAHDHPGDPRAFLLMGHSDVREHHYNDAMDHYETAMTVNEMARLDPEMIESLVIMSASSDRDAQRRARRTVVRLYARDALPVLRRVRVRLEDSEEIARLDALEEALEALPAEGAPAP
jgi:eukaryotic-like serine/threonine-protein kinase